MATQRTIIVAAVAGAVGLILGALGAGLAASALLNSAVTSSAIATLAVDGRVLEQISSNEIDSAKASLEVRLDSELVTIAAAVQDGYSLPSYGIDAVSRIARLRAASGYVPGDPTVRAHVAYALRLTDRK